MVTYLSAGVDGGAHVEPVGLVQKHAVKQITLPSAVHAGNRNHADWRVQLAEEFPGLVVDLKLCGSQLDELAGTYFLSWG